MRGRKSMKTLGWDIRVLLVIQTLEATKDDRKTKYSPLFTQGAPVEERTLLTMCRSFKGAEFSSWQLLIKLACHYYNLHFN